MATKDIADEFKGLNITQDQDINILLLGESGVGKSTFINSIANYLHFKQFKKASKEETLVLIPSLITITNEKNEPEIICVGSADKNEYQEVGAAGTQDVKTYVFPIGEGKTRLRLIDSPGLADPRGIEQDNTNCEHILEYLSQLKELHAICILMKPTTTRITVQFKYCIKEILSRLEKSASKNIIFIFTNTRGSNYTPGDTLPCLKILIDEIKAQPPHVEIPLKGNLFSFDNEAFKFLVASKHGINHNESDRKICNESWDKSLKESWRLISYIVGDASRAPLKPHQVQNTTSINEARRLIVQLSQPLADISQLIYDNIRILEKHQYNLRMENQSLDALKQKLYIPIIDIQVTELTQPVTVCTSTKCADVVKVGDKNKWHYKQRCHDPCYLTGVAKEYVGDPLLLKCAAMNGGRICVKCTCDFSVHMHVYYFTKTVDGKILDGVVQSNIQKKETALLEAHRLIGQIGRRKKELEEERETIIRSTAQFAHFLQHNAISPFNDSYKAYIEYLINREKGLGFLCDLDVVRNLKALLRQYEEIKESFDKSLKLNGLPAVTAHSVMEAIQKLYKLKHNGNKIHELIKKQKISRSFEYDKNCEYVHPKSTGVYTRAKEDKSKMEKKNGAKSTDDEKKKDGNKTDGRKKNFKNQYHQKPHFQQRSNSSRPYQDGHQQNLYNPPRPYVQEPPPPYSAVSPNYPINYTEPSYLPFQRKHGVVPNVVKLELSIQNKNSNSAGYQHYPCFQPQGPPGPGQYHGPPQNPYHYGSHQTQYHGPPHTPYHGASHGHQYEGPPHGQYHGAPHRGQYGHHPQGQYHGSHRGQYNDPPQGQLYTPQNQYHGNSQGQCRGPPLRYQYTPQNRHQGPPGGQVRPSSNQNSALDHHERQDRESGKENSSTSSSNASKFNPFIFLKNIICTIEFLILHGAFLCWFLYYHGYVLLLILLEAILCWHLYNGYVLFLILLAAMLCWYLYNCFASYRIPDFA